LVLAINLEEEALRRLVEQVACLQQETMAFEPVFVTSSADFRLFDSFGFNIEHVMSYGDWSRLQDPARWIHYLEVRLDAIVRTYSPSNILIASGFAGNGELDKNLYGCLMRLSTGGVVGDRLSEQIDNVAEEVELINLNLLQLERKIDESTRSILRRLTDPKHVQRLKQTLLGQPAKSTKR
jgi:hypothetical protein